MTANRSADVKVVILAGGLGTRLSEETELKPKPMVEVGDRPLLWHIMKHYAHHGFSEFYVPLGYKGEVIKRFFLDYHAMTSDMTIDVHAGNVERHGNRSADDWKVHLIDTGHDTNTGGRLKRLEPHLRGGTFMLTYGDGVSNIDLKALYAFHKSHGKIATVSAVRPPARFGGLVFEGNLVVDFQEKPQVGEGWINGGFMVFEPAVFEYLPGDAASLEAVALDKLASDRQLAAWPHQDFWQCVDTLRELRLLQQLWKSGQAPWRVWPR
jgi:glucose-1-phosphate cytidylyltransferase